MESAMSLSLTSSSFTAGDSIPEQHTCDGPDRSPPLSWSGVPAGTKSLALIVDDPDAPDPAAPKMTWVHWVLYNIPSETSGLAEGIRESELPAGTRAGLNDWKKPAYGGPCPPVGRHRYFHKLYALDVVLPDLRQPTKRQLEQAMQGHVLEQCELVGTYQRANAGG
jgi:Raf kinase inhibitor-like YbhB/YbcL family protein